MKYFILIFLGCSFAVLQEVYSAPCNGGKPAPPSPPPPPPAPKPSPPKSDVQAAIVLAVKSDVKKTEVKKTETKKVNVQVQVSKTTTKDCGCIDGKWESDTKVWFQTHLDKNAKFDESVWKSKLTEYKLMVSSFASKKVAFDADTLVKLRKWMGSVQGITVTNENFNLLVSNFYEKHKITSNWEIDCKSWLKDRAGKSVKFSDAFYKSKMGDFKLLVSSSTSSRTAFNADTLGKIRKWMESIYGGSVSTRDFNFFISGYYQKHGMTTNWELDAKAWIKGKLPTLDDASWDSKMTAFSLIADKFSASGKAFDVDALGKIRKWMESFQGINISNTDFNAFISDYYDDHGIASNWELDTKNWVKGHLSKSMKFSESVWNSKMGEFNLMVSSFTTSKKAFDIDMLCKLRKWMEKIPGVTITDKDYQLLITGFYEKRGIVVSREEQANVLLIEKNGVVKTSTKTTLATTGGGSTKADIIVAAVAGATSEGTTVKTQVSTLNTSSQTSSQTAASESTRVTEITSH